MTYFVYAMRDGQEVLEQRRTDKETADEDARILRWLGIKAWVENG